MPDETTSRLVDLAVLVMTLGAGAWGGVRIAVSAIRKDLKAIHDELLILTERTTESEHDIEGLEDREDQ